MAVIPVVLAACLGLTDDGNGSRPNILHIILDDYGWADAGWHRDDNYTDLRTPTMDGLVKEGVELDRFYAFQFCSPSRCAFQTGRNPIHVNVLGLDPTWYNQDDPVSGYSGIPRNMTGIAEVMHRANYTTHMYGKWDVGMATYEHTPRGRGYDHSLIYYHESNDYWNSTAGTTCPSPSGPTQIIDLWSNTGPATGINNPSNCSQDNQTPSCVYEDALFAGRVVQAVGNATGKPDSRFFIVWSPHIVHEPLQVPSEYIDMFRFINDTDRRLYHAMTYFVDEAIGNVTALLKATGLWNNTLVVVHSDNGGPIYPGGGGNNYPLKGGKMSNWEGGIRVNGFVSGGAVPGKMRGQKVQGYVTAWDWYSTYAYLGGVNPNDSRAEAARLPPIDSFNVWPYLSGQVTTSPRNQIPLGNSYPQDPDSFAETELGGLINGDYKILIGTLTQSGWTGPQYPNTSSTWNPSMSHNKCGELSTNGCLFNIINDPGEHHNIAEEQPELFKQMYRAVKEIGKNMFSPNRGKRDPAACHAAVEMYDGYWGPFVV